MVLKNAAAAVFDTVLLALAMCVGVIVMATARVWCWMKGSHSWILTSMSYEPFDEPLHYECERCGKRRKP